MTLECCLKSLFNFKNKVGFHLLKNETSITFMINNINVRQRNIGFIQQQNKQSVRVWAPKANQVQLIINEKQVVELLPEQFGYWTASHLAVEIGDNYRYRLINNEGTLDRSDPVSLCLPNGIHADGVFYDLNTFDFNDANWNNIPLAEYIIYELHIGTFTPEGTFLAAIDKLDHLLKLGITAVEIMPVSSFPGSRNWGYDGVFPFAVQESYGGPEQLQNFVNECHHRGIAVILDVVYNHFGPEGNQLADFGPYFTDKYRTPWGQAINFDDAYCDGVRAYFIENVLMWLRDFHIDALRLDAVHAINDFSATHILAEIKSYVDQLTEITDKPYYLIEECDLNDVKYLRPLTANGYGMDAQWADDFHHALRVTVGEPKIGYYKDFNGISDLAKAYKQAFVYDGIYSEVRQKCYGSSPRGLDSTQFVVCAQNHDQVGNRMMGERSYNLYGFNMSKVLATAVLLSPFIPMLFMGEEWGETNPFLYFVSHTNEDLVEAVRKGRKEEFKAFQDEGETLDPQSENTFKHSKLQWQLLNEKQHQQLFEFYKDLIALRRLHPALKSTNFNDIMVQAFEDKNVLLIQRKNAEDKLLYVMNFSSSAQQIDLNLTNNYKCLINSNSNKYRGLSEQFDSILVQDDKLLIDPETALIFEYDSI